MSIEFDGEFTILCFASYKYNPRVFKLLLPCYSDPLCLLADSNLNIEARKLAFEILLTVDAYSVRRHIACLRLCKSRPRARFIRLCTVDRALMNFPIFYSAAGVAIAESQPSSPSASYFSPSFSFSLTQIHIHFFFCFFLMYIHE